MYHQDPLVAEVEAEYRALKVAWHQERSQLFAQAGDAVVDVVGRKDKNTCECGGKGAAKSSADDGHHGGASGADGTGDDGDEGDNNESGDTEDINEEYQSYQQWYDEKLAEIKEEVEMAAAAAAADAMEHDRDTACTRFAPPGETLHIMRAASPKTPRPASPKSSSPKSDRPHTSAKITSVDGRVYQTIEEYLYEHGREELESYRQNYYEEVYDELYVPYDPFETVDCGVKLAGNCQIGDPCNSNPPCFDSKSLWNFWQMDFSSALDDVKLNWKDDAHKDDYYWESTAIMAAFAVLKENTDIVEWIEKRIAKDTKITDYLRSGNGGRLHIGISGIATIFQTHDRNGHIDVPQNGDDWAIKYLEPWKKPIEPERDRMTLAIDLSGTFLHEMVHSFKYHQADGDVIGTHCKISFIIENMYRWAMFKRYGQTLKSKCLPNVVFDDLWGLDTGIFPSICSGSTIDWSITNIIPWFPASRFK